MIPFNHQSIVGNELLYIEDAYKRGKVSGGGKYTKLCEEFMESRFDARKVLLVTSCTHALEMAALLLDIKEGDEVIMPSYTFSSTANAFVLRGAKPVFVDIREDTLNMDESQIERVITDRTKAIVPVHYAGVPCNMEEIVKIARKYDLYVVEDAAQAVNAKYEGKYAGTIGDFGCYSFHETKNYSMGEGGALVINNERFVERAEIIREKGTNRQKFLRGEIDKYTWVDIGSSYIPSEVNAAILWAQFERFDEIHAKRRELFMRYLSNLKPLEKEGLLRLPVIPDNVEPSYHIFYILLPDEKTRESIRSFLLDRGIHATFHYIPLHMSEYYISRFGRISLPVSESVSRRILRLPLYFGMELKNVDFVSKNIYSFFGGFKGMYSMHGGVWKGGYTG